MVSRVHALKWCGEVRGTTKPNVFRCSDGEYYVVKNPKNVQGARTLANELLGALVMKRVGIPTPEPAVVEVGQQIILDNADELRSGRNEPWISGPSFGSRIDKFGWQFIVECPRFSYVPGRFFDSVRNREAFLDTFVFDVWSFQTDTRQAIFVRPKFSRHLTTLMIDNGLCFGGTAWKTRDLPESYAYLLPQVFDSVFGMDAFEQFIRKMERCISFRTLSQDASEIPCEWYDGDEASLGQMIETFAARISGLEQLVAAARERQPRLFRNWKDDWRNHPIEALARMCTI